MKYFDMAELNGKLYPLGRTLLDHDSKILYFILPILLIYPFVQKYLVRGVVVGAVKG